MGHGDLGGGRPGGRMEKNVTAKKKLKKEVRERAAKKSREELLAAGEVVPVIKKAMCPNCKRIAALKLVPNLGKTQELDLVFETHDVASMCRMVCNGSKQIVGYKEIGAAADEIVRLRRWLHSIAYTPHLGCAKAPTNAKEILEQVHMAEEVHGKGENPNCGACKAQAALSGRDAP